MNNLVYDIQTHFAEPDRERLRALAAAAGQSVGDFIEETLKRAIFAAPRPAILPRPHANLLRRKSPACRRPVKA